MTRLLPYTGFPIAAGTSDSCICAGLELITLPSSERTRIQFTRSRWCPGW